MYSSYNKVPAEIYTIFSQLCNILWIRSPWGWGPFFFYILAFLHSCTPTPGPCLNLHASKHPILDVKGSYFRQREREKEKGNTCHFIAMTSPKSKSNHVYLHPIGQHIVTSGTNETDKGFLHFRQIKHLSSTPKKRLDGWLAHFYLKWREGSNSVQILGDGF